jgi:hypothetical protein
MDEARKVLERLERIEALKAANAEPGALLGELRALVADGEAWLATERALPVSPRPEAEEEASATRAEEALAGLEASLGMRGAMVTGREGVVATG